MLDRSAELRAAGGGEPPGPAAALPPLAAGLDQRHLTEAEREQATHDILRAFLAASIKNSNGSSSSSSSSNSSWFGPTGDGSTPHFKRGLQGQVVEHLMAGGFDEALLKSVPTHTLNWAIKVGRYDCKSVRRLPLALAGRSSATAAWPCGAQARRPSLSAASLRPRCRAAACSHCCRAVLSG